MKYPPGYFQSRNIEALKQARNDNPLSGEARRLLEDFQQRRVNPTTELMVEALGSDYFANLTLDASHNRLVGAYRGVMSEWRRIANVTNIGDFKLHNATAVSGLPDLDIVTENGEYLYRTRKDEARGTLKVVKRGNIFSLSMEASANDALGGLMDSAAAFGRSAARTLDKHVLATNLSDNPVIYDSTELVGSGHNNWNGTGALTDQTVEDGLELMFAQTGISSTDDEMEATPVALLVNPNEYLTAKRIVDSERVIAAVTTAVQGDINPMRGIVEVVQSRRIASGKRFLIANPSDVDMLEVGFFRGQEEPETFVEDVGTGSEFIMDARRVKVRHIWGTAWRDFRGVVGWGFADPH